MTSSAAAGCSFFLGSRESACSQAKKAVQVMVVTCKHNSLSFSKALWDLSLRLEELREVAATLAAEHERSANALVVAPMQLERLHHKAHKKRTIRFEEEKKQGECQSILSFTSSTTVQSNGAPTFSTASCRDRRQNSKAVRRPVMCAARLPLHDEDPQLAARGQTDGASCNTILPRLRAATQVHTPSGHSEVHFAEGDDEVKEVQVSGYGYEVAAGPKRYARFPLSDDVEPEATLKPSDRSGTTISEDDFHAVTNVFTRISVHSAGSGSSHLAPVTALDTAPIELPTNKDYVVRLRKFWEEVADEIDNEVGDRAFVLKSCSTTEEEFCGAIGGTRSSRKRAVYDSEEKLKTYETDRHPFCVLHPVGKFRLFWCLIGIVFLTYDLIFIPMGAYEIPEAAVFLYIDWTITVFWTLDLLLNFRIGFMNGSQLEMRPWVICVRYIKTWLVLDVLVVCTEWMGKVFSHASLGGDDGSGTGASGYWLRVARAVRSVRLLRIAKMPETLRMVEDQLNSSVWIQLCLVALKMTIALLFIVHFLSCAWYAVGKHSNDGWVTYASQAACGHETYTSDNVSLTWDVLIWYTYSARWVLAQVNGRIDQDPRRNMFEMAFTCIVAVSGPLVFMSIFCSSITATLMEINNLAQEKRNDQSLLKTYMNSHRISPELCSLMNQHLRQKHGENFEKVQESEKRVLSMFPQQIQMGLLYETRRPTVIEHKFFYVINKFNSRLLSQLTKDAFQVLAVEHEQVVFQPGDVCTRMLFVYWGHFMYSQQANFRNIGEVACRFADYWGLPPGGSAGNKEFVKGVWLSEGALWLDWVNQGTLAAYGKGSFLALDAFDFERCVKDYKMTLATAVSYASEFERVLKTHGSLSDIISLDVRVNKRRLLDNLDEVSGSMSL